MESDQIARILDKFERLGYTQRGVQLTEQTMREALNNISLASTNSPFDQSIADQLWQESPKLADDRLAVYDLATTIHEGIQALTSQYEELLSELKQEDNSLQRKELLIELFKVQRSHRLLTNPFQVEQLKKSPLLYESLALIPEKIRNESNYIFSDEPNEETRGLKLVLWIAMLSLGLEMTMMFHKYHFYTLLCLCAVLCIFFLNYFDRMYVKVVMANLLISCVMDVIWEITRARDYWADKNFLVSCHSHSSLLKLIIFCVVAVSVGKMMMVGLLYKYRNNPSTLVTSMDFLGIRFKLDANPLNNPVTELLSN